MPANMKSDKQSNLLVAFLVYARHEQCLTGASSERDPIAARHSQRKGANGDIGLKEVGGKSQTLRRVRIKVLKSLYNTNKSIIFAVFN